MKTSIYLIVCLALLPLGRANAEQKTENGGPFVDYDASLDPEAAAAFSDAVRRHASGATIPAEMAHAQVRLERRLAVLSAQAAQRVKGGTLPAASRALQETPGSRSLAQNLDQDLAGIVIDPGPGEFQKFVESTGKAGNSLNTAAAARNLQGEAAALRAEVRQAVDEELAGTLETLERASSPQPGSEAPK